MTLNKHMSCIIFYYFMYVCMYNMSFLKSDYLSSPASYYNLLQPEGNKGLLHFPYKYIFIYIYNTNRQAQMSKGNAKVT